MPSKDCSKVFHPVNEVHRKGPGTKLIRKPLGCRFVRGKQWLQFFGKQKLQGFF
jgi:hypothetical protein